MGFDRTSAKCGGDVRERKKIQRLDESEGYCNSGT